MGKSIYVGIMINAEMDAVWQHTQSPKEHERWDLRFTSIEYLPKESQADLQRFIYSTNLGFGFVVSGWGESIASVADEQARTSSLKFGCEHPISLIRKGSGYWKYTQTPNGIAFETGYNYDTRWGALGAVLDKLVYRPMMGYATAWSFDRLRLWLEQGIDPALSIHRALVHTVARISLAFIFAWHGLIPKLIVRHPHELRLIEESGFTPDAAQRLLTITGYFEVVFAIVLLLLWRVRWIYVLAGSGLVTLLIAAIRADRGVITEPFTPITLTAAMLGLCVLGWFACVDLPSARRCARTKVRFDRKENLL